MHNATLHDSGPPYLIFGAGIANITLYNMVYEAIEMGETTMYGSQVVVADRWYPSSKTCGDCGSVIEALPLAVRCQPVERKALTADSRSS